MQLLLCLAGEFFGASGELQWSVLNGFGELSFLSDLVELGLGLDLLPSVSGVGFVVGGLDYSGAS